MAIKTFGYSASLPNSAFWGGVPYYANVGYRTTMPEKGKVLSIKLKLARYSDSDVPIVWGVIWNRSTGAKIVQSTNSQSPTNTFSSASTLVTYTFDFPETEIQAGTLLWIGYGKVSNQNPRALYFGKRTSMSGHNIDSNDVSQSTPASTFSVGDTFTNEALWVEVTYKTGGQVKVWDGSAQAARPAKVWNGSSCGEKPVKAWDGSSWNESND